MHLYFRSFWWVDNEILIMQKHFDAFSTSSGDIVPGSFTVNWIAIETMKSVVLVVDI